MKDLFFISDIHGCFTAMIDALNESGFDENNEKHMLVVLGDIFDRGRENVEVYNYLKRLTDEKKAVVISGNHHKFLIDYLDGTSISPFNYMRNGVNETLADFLGRTRPFESWCLIDKKIEYPVPGDFAEFIKEARDEINEEYPELLGWLKSLPHYFESKHYIGVHGAIDTQVADWHFPHCELYGLLDWEALEFDDGAFFGKSILNTEKTVVIGHFGTAVLRDKYNIKDGKPIDDILIRNDGRVVAIDATTIVSNKVNVFVVRDEEI